MPGKSFGEVHDKPNDALRHSPTCCMTSGGSVPMRRMIISCLTVKIFSHEMAESLSNPACLPAGEDTSIKSCVGSVLANRIREVI